MPRKTIIIFISVFVIIGAVMLGFYYYKTKQNSTTGINTNSVYNIFNPFGSGGSTTGDGTSTDTAVDSNTQTGEEPITTQNEISKLHKITDFAVAGATYFDDTRLIEAEVAPTGASETTKIVTTTDKKGVVMKPTLPKFETVPSIRYVERMTGHIYQMYLDTKAEGKVSNSTIPSISEVLFDGSAKSVIYRYISSDNNSISSFIGTLGAEKSEFLPSNIVDISLSPDKTKFFYITKNTNGVVGNTRSFIETKTSQIWSSAYTEWISQWAIKDKIFLTTKASWGVDGSMFSINTTNGSLSKIFGGVKGLTTLVNNDGSLVLYSASTSSGPNLAILNIKTHNSFNLDMQGLAEKCIWSTDNINIYCATPDNISGGEYPDSWYQGLTSFNDHFTKINTSTGEKSEIISYNNPELVDATNLFLSKDENTLFFINRKDSTLWSLDLK